MRWRRATIPLTAAALMLLGAHSLPVRAADPPAAEVDVQRVMAGVEANQAFETRTSTVKLTVTSQGRRAEYQLRALERASGGDTDIAIEFLAPARDKGTKVVRVDGKVWRYEPRTERAEPLTDAALRQPMNGSDLTWADLVAPFELGRYTPRFVRDDTLGGKPVRVVELTSESPKTTPYAKRIAWIDPRTQLPVKQELYGATGILLKTWTMSDAKQVSDHWVPMRMVVSDAVQQGSTTLERSDVQIGGAIDEAVFTPAWIP